MNSSAASESSFINTINGIVDIKSFSKQEAFLNVNRSLFSKFQDNILSLGRTKINIGFEAGLFSSIIETALIALCSFWVIKESMTTGVLVAVIGICSTIFSTITGLASIMIPINEAKVAFQRMYEFVDVQEELGSDTNDNTAIDYDATPKLVSVAVVGMVPVPRATGYLPVIAFVFGTETGIDNPGRAVLGVL